MSRGDYDYPRESQRGGYYAPHPYDYYNPQYYPPPPRDYYYDPQPEIYYDKSYDDRRGASNSGGRRRRRGGGNVNDNGGDVQPNNRSPGKSRRGRQGGGGRRGGGRREEYVYPEEPEYAPEEYYDEDERPQRNDRRRRGRRSNRRNDNNNNGGGRRRKNKRGGRQRRGGVIDDGQDQAEAPAGGASVGRNEQWVKKPEQEEDTFDYEDENWKQHIASPEEDTRYRTEDVTNTKGATFEEYNLSRPLLRGLYEAGFLAPSPVQEESIPLIFMGKNVMVRAKNGTGKTGAYAIPCLERVEADEHFTQVLVLVPTRELALQTSKVIRDLGKYLNVFTVVTTGGTSLKDDIIRLKRTVHVLVGTPGRVLDLLQNRHADLSSCRLLVMDEADKLLSPDFVPLIENILQFSPDDRQLMLYSATFPAAVQNFQQDWMPDCEQVNLMNDLTLRGVTQYYAFVTESEKVHCLFTLFKMLKINQSIIFCNSINRVELLARKIHKLGFSSFYIHAKMKQNDRNRVFHQFRMGKCRTLVCTDLITRGIDIQSVNVVINFDFPKASETYLHRIGRSGRFGHLGLAINFITDQDRMSFYTIERELQTQIESIPSVVDEKLYCA